MTDAASNALRRMNQNYWIAKADDIAEEDFGFSVFDLPDGDFDELISRYEKGWTPAAALVDVHGIIAT